jgi:hypothetical protein
VAQPTPSTSPQVWLAAFLEARGLTTPDAQPLHRYQASLADLTGLKELLRETSGQAEDHLEHALWAGAFCLAAAESYRREHPGEEASWSTGLLEEALGLTLTDAGRAHLIAAGLAYWRRPQPGEDRAADPLAALRREGGLPWKDVERHLDAGIDTAIRHTLRQFHRTAAGGQTSSELLAEAAGDLPAGFLTLDTRMILAGIVEQLMDLSRRHTLADQPDPAAWLDAHAAGWAAAFPFPPDEPRAHVQLGLWLKEASTRHRQQSERERLPRGLACEHWLSKLQSTDDRLITDWRLGAAISLPAEDTISVDLRTLGSTRLVLAVYEGERLLELCGVLHAQPVEDGLKVRYPDGPLQLERQNMREPLSVRVLESGRCIHSVPVPGSVLELDEQPLVLEPRDGQQWLAATASCRLAGSVALVRVPAGAEHDAGSPCESFTEQDGACWVRPDRALTVRKGGEVYRVALDRPDPLDARHLPRLQGVRAQLPADPGIVFLGWPTLEVPAGSPLAAEDLEVFIDGEARQASHGAGAFHYSVRSRAGDTLLTQHIGVLPQDFGLSLVPAAGAGVATVLVSGGQDFAWRLQTQAAALSGQGAQPIPIPAGEPGGLSLSLAATPDAAPITLPLRHPSPGARLIDGADRACSARELTLQELQGARILLCASTPSGQDFHLQLDLLSSAGTTLRQHHVIRVGDAPLSLSLGGYLAQIQQMLGAVDDPDAYVRLAVETNKPLLQINIRRFGSLLESAGEGSLRVCDIEGRTLRTDAAIEAERLDGAARTRRRLPGEEEAGVFSIPAEVQQEGVWLLHPARGASVRFRPELREGAAPGAAVAPLLQLLPGGEVAGELRAMAADLDRAGWQHLDDLRRDFGHLPLATFQGWRALGSHPDALTVALLRLGLDERFCERIHDELAVLWEYIPVDVWVRAFAAFRAWAVQRGLPQALLSSLLENRRQLLRAVVPGVEFIGDYLASGQKGSLKKPPIELVLPYHYQELRRTHQANDRWPTELAAPLAAWLERQPLPRSIRKLSNTTYSDAVTYLPIFMAHVTAGKASLAVLPGDPAHLKLVIRRISEFDRGWYLYVHSVLVSYLLAAEP